MTRQGRITGGGGRKTSVPPDDGLPQGGRGGVEVIEPTDEMVKAFRQAALAEGLGIESGLAAVLAIVERDYDVTPKLPPVEHRPKGDIWWNLSAETYEAECVCGEEFSGWPRSDAEERLLTHLEREARP